MKRGLVKLSNIKRALLCFISFFVFHFSLSQTWEPVGSGIKCSDSEWVTGFNVASPADTVYSSVYTMCVYKGKLYAGGMFKKAGAIKANNIAMWDGHKWDSLGAGIGGWVMALAIHGEILNVGGVFNRAGGKYSMNIAKWIDTTNTSRRWYYYQRGVYRSWSESLYDKQNITYSDEAINAVIDYKGDTYIGGHFTYSYNHGSSTMTVWDSKKEMWVPINGVLPKSVGTYMDNNQALGFFIETHVICFSTYKNKLYIISSPEGEKNTIVWDGVSFKKLPGNFPDVFLGIQCTTASDSGLYFGGWGANEKGLKQAAIVRLNNDETYKTIYGLPNDSKVYCMVYYANKLYIGGQFDSIAGKPANNIAMWDGQSWHTLGAGLTKKMDHRPTAVRCLCVYNGYLYAGGSLDHSGNKPIANIARFKLQK